MNLDGRKAKEYLARAKAYFQRHEVMRSLEAVTGALKLMQAGVAGQDKTSIDSALREMIQLLNRTDEIKTHFPKGLAFQPGMEKALYVALSGLLQALQQAQELETYTQTLERKNKLDKLYNYGAKLLEAGKVQDAEGAFQEAIVLYVDEHALFRMIGEACLAVKQPKMAAKYLKQALKIGNEKEIVGRLLVRALEEGGNIPAARKLEADLKLA